MLGCFENTVLGTVNTSIKGIESSKSSISMKGSCDDCQLVNQ